LVKQSTQRVQALFPELAVMGEPVGSLPHRHRGKRATDDPSFLDALYQARVLENAQMLHEPGQGHLELPGQLRHRKAAFHEQLDHPSARRVRERGEYSV